MMRGIRMLLASLAVLLVIIFLFSLLFSSTAKMQRAGVIQAPAVAVFDHLQDTAAWKYWYPWPVSQDPAHGKLVIDKVVKDSLILYRVLSTDERLNINGSIYLTQTSPTATTINWSMERHVGVLPWWKLRGLLMDKLYGPAMEKGLSDLKKLAEGQLTDTSMAR